MTRLFPAAPKLRGVTSVAFVVVVAALLSAVAAQTRATPLAGGSVTPSNVPDSCTASRTDIQVCQAKCLTPIASGNTCSGDECCAVPRTSDTIVCVQNCCFIDKGPGTVLQYTTDMPCDSQTQSSSSPRRKKKKKCFPSNAVAELESGAKKHMHELRIGDRVKVARGLYSDVYMFTHSDQDVRSQFVVIRTASDDAITLTHGHYIYLNGALVEAQYAQVGDEIILGVGVVSRVVTVRETIGTGLYNPQTLHGDIVVDGIVASTYTTAVSPVFGHAALSVTRALYSVFGISGGNLKNGADAVADALPSGPAFC